MEIRSYQPFPDYQSEGFFIVMRMQDKKEYLFFYHIFSKTVPTFLSSFPPFDPFSEIWTPFSEPLPVLYNFFWNSDQRCAYYSGGVGILDGYMVIPWL